jgi:hypothetical protein
MGRRENKRGQQIPEYDLRPQMKYSTEPNAREKEDIVSDKHVKKYDI